MDLDFTMQKNIKVIFIFLCAISVFASAVNKPGVAPYEKYVDEIIEYKTEKELIKLIKKVNPDVLFLGDDYKNKENNGTKLEIKTHYINRDHGWSSTKLKNEIKNRF